jgi:predicted TIM-barrel fold metal-dependent hydrolase
MRTAALDVDALTAIDVHVHAHAPDSGEAVTGAARRYFGESGVPLALDELAAYYRERTMACVLFTVDEHLTGRPVVPNDDVLAAAAAHPDVLIAFASVDPTRGTAALDEARRLIAAGARGFKLHPPLQQFEPNDRRIYPFYELVQAARLPVIFHTGHNGIGTGMRGGGGVRLKYGHPMLIDDVAVDFPDLPIVMAHPSFPWQDEAISVCLHKAQVYIDLSGWSPKYFSPTLVRYADTLLREKVLFGSDYPMIAPDRWLKDFASLPIRDEVRPLILKENAARLLGLRAG